MRARNLKPGFFKNEELLALPFECRLLFAGLWCMADREGRLEDRPLRIKIELFPMDDVDVDALLDQLQERKMIQRYEADEARCIAIPNFTKHQNPHVKEAPSTIPAPDEHGANTTRAGLNPSSLNPSSPVSCGKEEEERARLIDTLTPVENLKRRGGHRSEPETFGGLMAEVLGGGL